MEERVEEVLFETRRHASRPYISNYPPLHHQPKQGARWSFLASLLPRGIIELKEKWSTSRNPRKLSKYVSLFVSARGDHVAVATGNQITILQKEDDYQEPCGIFTSEKSCAFTCGTWSEAHDILGVADDADILYFIRANGEEITQIAKRHLRVSSPIIGLTAQDTGAKESCLCTFSVLMSDGSLRDVEISQDPTASIFSAQTLNTGSILMQQLPMTVLCLDYNSKFSVFAFICSGGVQPMSNRGTGSYTVSIWQRARNLNLELLASCQFEGWYSLPEGYDGQLTFPKVLISSQRNFVATLDMRGSLLFFKFDNGQRSLSNFCCGEGFDSKTSVDSFDTERGSWNDIVDFAWWSDNVVTVAKRSGTVTMFDIRTGVKLLQNDPVYSMPLLERVEEFPGRLFLLESLTSTGCSESSEAKSASNLHIIELTSVDKHNQLDFSKLQWGLISFSERSVAEMYDILIAGQEYQAALNLADRHGLDKDETRKAQWLTSCRGVKEIRTLLSAIMDQSFVLSECMEQVGPTEESTRALLDHGLCLTDSYRSFKSETDSDNQIWHFRMARLKLLQFRDRLETFLGINMGRFSVQEYHKFRNMPIKEVAISLAENGKIGALNLLFKRHSYSLAPFLLEVLDSIPETVPVQTYSQLLPGNLPPPTIVLREEDWVECNEMMTFVSRLPEDHESSIQIRTEPIVKRSTEFQWPSVTDLSLWYKKRAREIDALSGQLENCISLIDLACRKGIHELKQFLDDISYLSQLIYSDGAHDGKINSMSLTAWEELPDYEKFKLMLKGAKEETIIDILRNKAIPFMKKKLHTEATVSGVQNIDNNSSRDRMAESFLVRWLKEISGETKLDMCLIVIEEGCREFYSDCFFLDETEAVDCALQCIYLCSTTDKWSTMASILSKLPQLQDFKLGDLKKRVKLAEGHIEAGRLLELYQVPKPINFFLGAHFDAKNVKQVIRLMLSKFVRRQQGRSDNDWANMWSNLQILQEKAFPFIDPEYMLMEFCRGLLKAGKFSLARNYLKGIGSVALATDKAENLVIQAAREYFYSAPSLACSEIWKAKECLNILSSSRNVRAEADIIDAITVKLPTLGVNFLPMQFKQIKDPMEVIKLAITGQTGAYLNVDEIVEVAKLLGMNSQDDISAVQEVIAREAAVVGDVQLAFDLCLILARKGHGTVWDLCAALARGPVLENMDISSRKQLLGFALSHCDEESIGELLLAWKDLDMQGQCESLEILTGKEPSSTISHSINGAQGVVGLRDWAGQIHDVDCDNKDRLLAYIKNMLLLLVKNSSVENDHDCESLLRENGKILSFADLYLPWLLELSREAESEKKSISSSISGKQYFSARTQAVVTILSWLVRNGFAPKDDLIVSIAKSIMESPVTEEEDVIGCSFLLNVVDAFYGAEIIEEHLKRRKKENEVTSIMNVGMIYGLLHNSGIECEDPTQRRDLLQRKFQRTNRPVSSDERDRIDKAQSTFWKEWKIKLEEQKRMGDQSRFLEQMIPGVETARFLNWDIAYIESVVFSLIESVKLEKKQMLKDVLELTHTYGLDKSKMLLHYLRSILISEVWTVDDITAEMVKFKKELLSCASEAIKVISLSIYPEIDGHDKQRLSIIYGLLSDCYMNLEEPERSPLVADRDPAHKNAIELAQFYKVVEQECNRISVIEGLNFKNIAQLQDLNLDCFNDEVCSHINENTVDELAKMVQNLVAFYGDRVPLGLLQCQCVYRHHILSLLTTLENKAKSDTNLQYSESIGCFVGELEQTYDICRRYLKCIACSDLIEVLKRFFMVVVPMDKSLIRMPSDLMCQESLIKLLSVWVRLINDVLELVSLESLEGKFCSIRLMTCLRTFATLVAAGKVSAHQGWAAVIGYLNYGLTADVDIEICNFCRAMIRSGCGFESVANVFAEAVAEEQPGSAAITSTKYFVDLQDISHLYLGLLNTILEEISSGSMDYQNIYHHLSSLSKLEGNLETLLKVRRAVWDRMAEISDDLQLPSCVRVHILELMQFIAGTGATTKILSLELHGNLLPWEGWENLQLTMSDQRTATDDASSCTTDATIRVTNTLVALRSSQLLSDITTSLEIRPEDLLTVESAVFCFLKISEFSILESHIDVLIAILREWEGLFTSQTSEKEPADASDSGNTWSNDDWNDGWESFHEESTKKEIKEDSNVSVHLLHSCWMEIFKKLLNMSHYEDLLKLIDQSTAQNVVLTDEEDTRSLSQIALETDCFLALKLVLLFPYEAVRLQCLDAVENQLRQGDISDKISKDYDLLVLILSSGVLSTILNKAAYGTTFSYLCYIVGSLSRQWQEGELLRIEHRGAPRGEHGKENVNYLFKRLILPSFVSELVKADQQVLAGFLVTKFMHTNPALSLINVTEASLRRYLETQLQVLEDAGLSSEDMIFSELLSNAISSLRDRLEMLIRSALSLVKKDVR